MWLGNQFVWALVGLGRFNYYFEVAVNTGLAVHEEIYITHVKISPWGEISAWSRTTGLEFSPHGEMSCNRKKN